MKVNTTSNELNHFVHHLMMQCTSGPFCDSPIRGAPPDSKHEEILHNPKLRDRPTKWLVMFKNIKAMKVKGNRGISPAFLLALPPFTFYNGAWGKISENFSKRPDKF